MYHSTFAAAVAALALGVAGCGSTDDGKATASTAATPTTTSTAADAPVAPAPVELTVSGGQDITVRSPSARLSGTVTPGNASVTIDGRGVPVSGGRWRKTVRKLERGENSMTVAATAPGREDASTDVTITRQRSQAEIEAAVAARRERARQRAEAARVRKQQAVADFKASAQHLDYDQLVKNPENYDGAHVVFSGPILQIRDDGGSGFMLLNTSCDEYDFCDDLVYVEFDRSIQSAADDRVTVYGTITGGEEYDTQSGGSNFVPKLHLRYIEE